MMSILLKMVDFCGYFCGVLSRLLVPRQIGYGLYRFRRNFVSGRHNSRFMSYGSHTLLAPGVRLIHPENISLGIHSSVLDGCLLETIITGADVCPRLCIGNGVSLGENSHITCSNRVTLGNGILTGRYVLITDNAHGLSERAELECPPLHRKVVSKGEVWIGDNVWLGDRAVILPGVSIGNGAIIAANAVVTHDIPAFAIAAGVPAKVIKQR